MAGAASAVTPRPLTEDERATLSKLLALDAAHQGPAARIGDAYVALVNLSVPRRGDPDRQCDLVYAGETVHLTEEEAQRYLRHGPRDGRQVPVIRKLDGPDGSREPVQPVPPRAVSGRIFRPQPPAPGDISARPDPEGSSRVEYFDDAPVPERDQPQPDPAHMADQLRSEAQQDAVDIPPSRSRARQGRGQ